MKKNILIVILILITIFSMLYAYIKADEATKERMISELARNEALEEKKRGDAIANLAAARAAEAIQAKEEAEKLRNQLADCQSK